MNTGDTNGAAKARSATRRMMAGFGGILAVGLAALAGYAGGHQASTAEASNTEVVERVSYRIIGASQTAAPTYVFYLAGDENERDLLLRGIGEAANERASSGMVDPETSFQVLLAGKPADERQAWETIAGLVERAKGNNVDITIRDERIH